MESEKTLYTLIVHSENIAGVLNQITSVFTRRQINIESLNVSASSIKDIHRYTITAFADEDNIKKVVDQIEKKVDVLQCQYFKDEEIFMQEVALYKIKTGILTDNPAVSEVIRQFGGNITEVNPTYSVVEKTGSTKDILALNQELGNMGAVLQYVNSGRVAITRARIEHVSEYNEKMDAKYGIKTINAK